MRSILKPFIEFYIIEDGQREAQHTTLVLLLNIFVFLQILPLSVSLLSSDQHCKIGFDASDRNSKRVYITSNSSIIRVQL